MPHASFMAVGQPRPVNVDMANGHDKGSWAGYACSLASRAKSPHADQAVSACSLAWGNYCTTTVQVLTYSHMPQFHYAPPVVYFTESARYTFNIIKLECRSVYRSFSVFTASH